MMTRLTTVAGAVLGAIALLGGCSGTPPGEFIIVQNQVPAADCTIPPTLGAIYRGHGILDVRLTVDGHGYQLYPLLQNNFPPPSGQSVDANRIALSGFDVDVDLPPDPPPGQIKDLITMYRAAADGSPELALVHYGTLTSGSVASGGGNTASSVEAFPSQLAQRIRDMGLLSAPNPNRYEVMTSVRARGDNLVGGVRSDAFKYPIELCDGCLLVDQGTCPVAAALGNSCAPGQDDGAVGCCTLSGSVVCPSVVASK
jgi:hypothetical protein